MNTSEKIHKECPILFCAVLFFVMASILFWMFPANAPAAKRTHEKTHSEDILIRKAVKLLKGDLPAIKKRCYIRVLISCSKTNFFIEKAPFMASNTNFSNNTRNS